MDPRKTTVAEVVNLNSANAKAMVPDRMPHPRYLLTRPVVDAMDIPV